MRPQLTRFYEFDRFRIDLIERVLLRDGEIVPLTQKAFDLLIALVEERGRIVEKEELMQRVWPDSFVEEGNLTQNIYTLRKVLGQMSDGQNYIETVPRRGYRFAAEVSERGPAPSDERKEIPVAADFEVIEAETEPQVLVSADTSMIEYDRSPLEASRFNQSTRRKRTAVTFIIALAIVAVAIIAQRLLRPQTAPAQMTIASLTNTGNIQCATVSPEGDYVVYAMADKPHLSSLWIMQLATSTSQMILPPGEVQYHAATFSPDGTYIYYVMKENNQAPRTLYRTTRLGGPSRKLIERVDSPPSFSPDGKRFVFRRGIDDRRAAGLFIATAEGEEESELASINYPESFGDPAWSPDGSRIAVAAGHSNGGLNQRVVEVSPVDGTIKPISDQRWRWVGQMAWLRDSSGLVMVGVDQLSGPFQVWHLSYPGGEARKITNDSNAYNRLSLSADSRTLVALQSRQVTGMWIIPAEEPGRAKRITFGAGGYRGKLSWTPDGKIVYDSEAGAATVISIINADGSNPQQVTGDAAGKAYFGYATASPDGRYIVFSCDLAGARNIWRMNTDGSNLLRLTDGEGEDQPAFSPDGRWVVYTKLVSKKWSLWRVSIDGGEPVRLTDALTGYASVSPDGKLIACYYYETKTGMGVSLALIPFEGGAPIKVFETELQSPFLIRWTPDGRGLTYAENPIGTSKIWIQPVEGGPPKKLVEFETDRIFGFDWSRDGKQLACVRGIWSANAVVIKDFITN
jgi:Tol biopolymer transport system component/DNA-binding winged helix-turn-helix (wHTH) protein